ncbi:TEA/ATTS domain family-domain-containing protein [Mycena metata]|uniref:TEA/ATTS domain family-domain-containing protein n=1 Tax=Mycena metata TaxID=1033252 RepID=A0AAD7K1H6_9AGAR|nr:TEA/ATTS domain family-domain-containing protein [Mycena metata]
MTHAFFVDTGSRDTVSGAALRTLLGPRHCWKKLHGQEVWPPHLEAALLEALEQYIPDDSRETRLLGRYRGRNQFVAEYIFRRTGEYRTNKQVGSRLQQMRHSTRNPKIQDLLNPLRLSSWYSRDRPQFSSSVDCSGPSPCPLHISVPIRPRSSPPAYPLLATPAPTHTKSHHLQDISPITTFLSPRPIIAQSWSAVVLEGQIIHTETIPLIIILEVPAIGTGFLHRTSLVPDYWQTILDSPDPTRFTVLQQVVKENNSAILFSAEYKFAYARDAAPPCMAKVERCEPAVGVLKVHAEVPLWTLPQVELRV